ncbi:uncharacterized protein LAESUDRAFT_670134 [Laetiporus sulphureus 93-53]|uniref:BTB domain-containing protein n=1 Tax=Laetiporus sulphureus 93-53 TaxID=1314785 RepID=A0A165HN36_9APHY|nr:uncharacterized protein LAESUDRAFT_670134 [Laetiporus sulphureus 93-53]KZT11953.1 hypothetical protein LAESUDRAFT_670134 [Laetiporus sulphureus 93-53]
MGSDADKSKAKSVPESKSATDFTPNTEIWYSDGSVVLVAKNIAYRVHATIMAAHCEVFKDMFSMPQPSVSDPDAETHEDVPVLRLQDDPVDLKHLLKAIYEHSYFSAGQQTKFPVVASVLRMSTKYDAPFLRQRAIDLLSTAYPSTLAAWDNRASQRLVPPFENELAIVIELAYETDVRVILPAAYFAASREPLSFVLPEFRRLSVVPDAQWDLCRDFVIGRERLQQAEITNILAFLEPTFLRPNCQTSNDATTILNTSRNGLRKIFDSEPYHQWCSAHPAEAGKALVLCVNCCTVVENSIREGRKNVWSQLPGLFGLANWETLRARDGITQ